MGTGRKSGFRIRRAGRIARRPTCEAVERRELLSILVVTDTNDDTNPNSLRWAIEQADASTSAAAVTIDFDIPGDGAQTIHLSSPLPPIDVPVEIDGTTQPGYAGTPLIEIDGSGLTGPGNDGLVATAGSSTIRGLALVGFSGSAIVLKTGGENAVAGDDLGIAPFVNTAIPNGVGISLLGSSFNTIGVGSAGLGNVISGNAGDGIVLQPAIGQDSASNLIVGNAIGTSPDGEVAIGNGGAGVDVLGAGGNSIGMPGEGFGNVISGNTGPGISVSDQAGGTQIRNNFIGVTADGTTPLGNLSDGIQLDDAPQTLVGGGDPGQGNVIAGNRGNGIATGEGTTGLLVAGNSIGTDPSGTLKLGNFLNGVSLASSSDTIGGTTSGSANVIDDNGSGQVGAGVELVGLVDQDTILSNSIDGNAGLGINFGNGPTPNHDPGTPGPNDYQNYPELSLAQNDGTATTVNGSLYESPNTTYLIQFFASPQPDPSGYGQGRQLLGAMNVTTNAQGNASFTAQLPPTAMPGEYVSATATDPSGNTSEFAADVAVQGQINLVLAGTATPNPVADGADLTYTLTVANQGTTAAQSVSLSNQLPAGVSLVTVSSSQGYVVPTTGGTTVDLWLGTIQSGASATVTIIVQTGPGSIGTITDTATVSSTGTEPDPAAETATILATVETAADVAVALTQSASDVLAGSDVTYTMTVSNLGPQGAADVEAALPLGAGLSFVSATSGAGSVALNGDEVDAQLGNLASGGQVVVNVVVQTTAAETLTETATVSSGSLDPNLSNNASSVTTEVEPACDLAVQVTADTTIAAQGYPFDYTVTVTNNGPCDATGVELSDTLPAGVTLTSTTTDPGVTTTVVNGAQDFAIGGLASGASSSVTLSVMTTAPPGSTLVDSATVQGDQPDPLGTNNSASLVLPVQGVSDLAVAATAGPGPYYAGQPLTYTIDVTNNGPAAEPDAQFSGAIPPGLLVDSTTSSQGSDPSVSQGIMTADLGALPSGQTATLTLVVTPGPLNVGVLPAGFSVQGQDFDPDPTNNSASVDVDVEPSSDLAVQIIPGNVAAVAQVDTTYTVKVTNAGPSAATDVTATVPLPAGAQLVSVTSSQGLAPVGGNGLLTADLETLAPGASATVTVVIDPSSSVGGGTIALSAAVSGDQYDPNPLNNQVSLTLAVAPSVDLALSLSSTPQVVESGQVVTFTASVSNLGSTSATGIVVAFPQVSGLNFVGSSPSQGTPALVSGQFFADLGDLDPGASATVAVDEQAMAPGTYAMTASVSQTEYNLDLPAASATTSAQVVESPGMIQFGAGSFEVTDQSGVAVLPVVRVYGASGTISIHYQTSALTATPGLDFTPTSGTLTLGPGQWTGSIEVPILDDPYRSQDTYLNVTLDSPTGGAYLGPIATSEVHIQDVDPDLTPPQVSNLGWSGSAQAITSLTLQFTAPLDPAYATDAADYHLVRLVGGQTIPIASISYDPTDFAVTIVPGAPLPSGRYYQVQVVGTGSDAIRDLAGNLLDGAGDGTAGTSYLAMFAQGDRLRYVDNNRNVVTLSVKGPGYLEQVLEGDGEGLSLDLIGMVPHRTTLTGRIKPQKRGSGQTELGQLSGLGQFGDVKVLLTSPPFRVTQLPFQRRGKFVL